MALEQRLSLWFAQNLDDFLNLTDGFHGLDDLQRSGYRVTADFAPFRPVVGCIVVIGVENGVMPVEQMQVTITKPLEDAINSVPGLLTVRSNTA